MNVRVSVTRRYHFSAAHRLHSPHLSAAENRAVFRECNNEDGHGHNFDVWVTIGGPVDPRTGMIVHLGELDGAMRELLLPLDHHFLSAELARRPEHPGAGEVWVSTAENVARLLLDWVRAALPARLTLERVTLDETASNRVETRGQDAWRDARAAR